jgi:hypothetical protein
LIRQPVSNERPLASVCVTVLSLGIYLVFCLASQRIRGARVSDLVEISTMAVTVRNGEWPNAEPMLNDSRRHIEAVLSDGATI